MSFNELPNHVILDIFEKVRAKDLKSIRLVCRKWAEVVSDSIALRRKHKLVVNKAALNENHEFLKTFLRSPYNICTEIYFENVHFADPEIVTRLWSKIGANIECLRFSWFHEYQGSNTRQQIYKINFITLLKYMPNLRELGIRRPSSSGDFLVYPEFEAISGEFNLKKLRKVDICCFDTFYAVCIMKLLTKSADRLTRIKYIGTDEQIDALYSLIESKRHSLKELIFNGFLGKRCLQQYLSIANLSLNVLDIRCNCALDSDLLQLLGNHKNLRELTCCIETCETVQQLSNYLPKLEKLNLLDYNYYAENMPFPKNLNHLKSLKLRMERYSDDLTFETPTYCPALEVFIVNNFECGKISSASLQSFIVNFPNLRVLILSNIHIDSSNVTAICDKLVHLEELNIRIISADPHWDWNALNNISNLNKLKELTVHNYNYVWDDDDDTFFIEHLRLPALIILVFYKDDCVYRAQDENVTDRGISGLIDNCPLLESLSLAPSAGLTEACLDEMVERLPHLRNISISGRSITNEKVYEINNYLRNRM